MHTLMEDEPEESNLRQQSENPYNTAKCKGNIPWIPRLEETKREHLSNEIVNGNNVTPFKPNCFIARYIYINASLY